MSAKVVAGAVAGADTKKVLIIGGVVVVGMVILYFGVYNPILKFFGLKDSKEDKQGFKASKKLSNKQVLSPQLYRDNKKFVSISSARANQLASQMHDGRGYYDDEAMGVGAITSAGSKVNISYIANQFNVLYGKDMESFMSNNYLEPSDFTQINDYIEKIKRY